MGYLTHMQALGWSCIELILVGQHGDDRILMMFASSLPTPNKHGLRSIAVLARPPQCMVVDEARCWVGLHSKCQLQKWHSGWHLDAIHPLAQAADLSDPLTLRSRTSPWPAWTSPRPFSGAERGARGRRALQLEGYTCAPCAGARDDIWAEALHVCQQPTPSQHQSLRACRRSEHKRYGYRAMKTSAGTPKRSARRAMCESARRRLPARTSETIDRVPNRGARSAWVSPCSSIR